MRAVLCAVPTAEALARLTASYVSATALTFLLGANEKSCYYIFNDKEKSNIGYYFAVQAGGSFDIDYTIKAPDGKIIVQKERERQGEYVFSADQIGEYEFCFSNEMSTYTEKVVDFEIKVNDDFKAKLPDAPQENEAVEGMQESINKIENKLNDLENKLQYYKTRNNRNQSTVKSTESRIFNFSILDVVLMCSMAIFQVLVVKFFFQGSRKQLV
ncbi:unnamed protein product [[Candida] boidinii]|uniref:Unnamed protein product n=1 Tax=Candida boidinii TaxID=5477 RepID=A0ACB5TIA0_CANBO|nr:unnamed protein product [[Candida] boidinii]